MFSTAEFSDCRTYRYSLTRIWDADQPLVMFIALNPSTADESVNDPTIRRCVGFAKQWDCGGLVMTNLFAFRSTEPDRLRKIPDPIGPENDDTIVKFSQLAGRIVLAWGIHGGLMNRDCEVLKLVERPYCFGTTKAGAPRHPLYLAGETPLIRFKKPRAARQAMT